MPVDVVAPVDVQTESLADHSSLQHVKRFQELENLLGESVAESSDGPVAIATEAVGDVVGVTDWHPFWVAQGENLDERPAAKALQPCENVGQSVEGRWVDSNDLRVGDVLVAANGQRSIVAEITEKSVVDLPVYCLTIADHPNYAVGVLGQLVHNRGWCDAVVNLFDTGSGLSGQELTQRVAQKRQEVATAWKHEVVNGAPILTGTHGHHLALKGKSRLINGVDVFGNNRSMLDQMGVPLGFGKTWVPGMDEVIDIQNADELNAAVNQVRQNLSGDQAAMEASLQLLRGNLSIGPSVYVHSNEAALHMSQALTGVFNANRQEINRLQAELTGYAQIQGLDLSNPAHELQYFQKRAELFEGSVVKNQALTLMATIRNHIENGRLINGQGHSIWGHSIWEHLGPPILFLEATAFGATHAIS